MTKKRLCVTVVAMAVMCALAWCAVRYFSPGGGVEPSWEEYPVRGIDISAHNGEIDFAALRRQGYRFVLIKATEGSAFKDSRFYTNISKARKAGLKVGAYHFFRFDATGYMQALNFVHSLRGVKLDMPAVIDVEQWTNPTNRPTQRVLSTLNTLITRLNKAGVEVMLYTNKDGYEEFLSGRFVDTPLWICTFSYPAKTLNWTLWQYTHRGRIDGVEGNVDINVFNGTVREWEAWCKTHHQIMQ